MINIQLLINYKICLYFMEDIWEHIQLFGRNRNLCGVDRRVARNYPGRMYLHIHYTCQVSIKYIT
jgi:hypothetical protein